MDKKSKIFFAVLFLLIAGSVALTYWRIMIKKDYVVEAQTDCDPETQKCFIWECDPASTVEGEACTGDEENDIWYYQIARRNASLIPLCDPDKDENCLPMDCDPSTENDCEIIFCNDENKIEQEVECNDPEEYLKNNPAEEDEDLSEEDETGDEGDSSAEEE
ncbi:MAG TPA: hypothetical protein P5232_04215 [Candidatus Moranbacteria bacterium]|nr:hypothetical protein [Candidatus Moranbacteria bacterium]